MRTRKMMEFSGNVSDDCTVCRGWMPDFTEIMPVLWFSPNSAVNGLQ